MYILADLILECIWSGFWSASWTLSAFRDGAVELFRRAASATACWPSFKMKQQTLADEIAFSVPLKIRYANPHRSEGAFEIDQHQFWGAA